MAPDPKTTKADKLSVAIGFTLGLGGGAIVVDPQDVSKIDDGTFTIDLKDDETRKIGSLLEFYKDLDRLAKDGLPNFPEDQVPAPLLEAAEAQVTLRRFFLEVEGFAVKQLEIDATMAAEWTLPNTELTVGNPRVVLSLGK